jgi:hypothetical protein
MPGYNQTRLCPSKLRVYFFIAIFPALGITGYAQCDTIDLAFGHPAVASSLENSSYPASRLFQDRHHRQKRRRQQ